MLHGFVQFLLKAITVSQGLILNTAILILINHLVESSGKGIIAKFYRFLMVSNWQFAVEKNIRLLAKSILVKKTKIFFYFRLYFLFGKPDFVFDQ
ncbi:hypothetical protein CDS02_09180 [Listeria monocytogenes]|nr:hypothetical protein [Listeria monocytogenes]EAD7045811.1 hypothetical protein [Listeria monocytogenes]EAE0441573.1 hypothetical protein [Listeria monocytogenes]EAF0604750.1 hypothetical protein [Listeria monocytogenes]EAG4538954.1 hypothetical protein [Listeria monocytogenes]